MNCVALDKSHSLSAPVFSSVKDGDALPPFMVMLMYASSIVYMLCVPQHPASFRRTQAVGAVSAEGHRLVTLADLPSM